MAVTDSASAVPGQATGLAALASDDPMIPHMTGRTAFFACRADPRFSYCLYVPRGYRAVGERLPLLVSVHDAARTAETYRDVFADFAEQHRCVIMAPLFPINASDLDSVHNYKQIDYDGVRFDQLMLAMVEEVTDLWRLISGKFFLFGFSAGGQFAHRFAYLHPGRLAALSVGAAGWITRPDLALSWPAGLRGVEELFGVPPDLTDLAEVPVQFVVGGDDTVISLTAGPQTQDQGEVRNRVANARLLCEDFKAIGVPAELAVVPGATHNVRQVSPAVREFFSRHVRKLRTN
jgi:pimeloyl-ACP methyl ester carboxylesterase